MSVDLLLTHGHRLCEDLAEQRHVRPYPPLGLLSLSAWLRRAGRSVTVVDGTFLDRRMHRRRLGAVAAPVLGIYANMMTRAAALELIAEGRERGQRVVVGGPDPSEYVEEYLDAGADAVVIGEGEIGLTELLDRWSSQPDASLEGIAGLAWRDRAGAIQREPARPPMRDLARLPWPDREAIDLQPYIDCWREQHGRGSLNLVTARGCAWRCRWCSHAVFGHRHARRSPRDVAEEVAWIRARYAPDQLWYADDVFTASRRWLRDFAGEMEQRGLQIPFECITRADRVDAETARLLAQLGCFRVWLGAESGSQPVLDAMERGTTAAQVRRSTGLLQAEGISVGLFVMWGYEGETGQDIEATIREVKRVRADRVLTTVAYPIRGTPYYQSVADKVRLRRPWAEGSDRDHAVLGRPGPAYYRAVSSRLQAELAQRDRLDAGRHPRAWPALLRGALEIAWYKRRMRRSVHDPEA